MRDMLGSSGGISEDCFVVVEFRAVGVGRAFENSMLR